MRVEVMTFDKLLPRVRRDGGGKVWPYTLGLRDADWTAADRLFRESEGDRGARGAAAAARQTADARLQAQLAGSWWVITWPGWRGWAGRCRFDRDAKYLRCADETEARRTAEQLRQKPTGATTAVQT